MADSRRHAVGRPGWWMLPLILTGSLAALLTASAVALTVRVAMLVIRPPRKRAEDVAVLHVDKRAGTVTLSDHVDAVVPGEYSLFFAGDTGRARIGTIVGYGSGTVTRELLAVECGQLRKGVRARVSGWVYLSPGDLGYDYEDVIVPTEFGPAPAWLVRSTEASGRWVIQVHGRGVDRTEANRAIPVFHDAGYTSLLISYRNDGVAPASSDGRYALGDTEWSDVDAAIRFAIEDGATDIVLMGWSMGGALVLQAATRSQLAGSVRGIILDSPVIDWVAVLDHQAGAFRIPAVIRVAVFTIISRPWGRLLTGQAAAIDLPRLDFVRRAGDLELPMLIMHSDSDSYVPSTASRELARSRPDIVTFESFSGAGHTRLWNYDRDRWNTAIRNWLARLGEIPA